MISFIKLVSAILGYFASEGKAENVYATNVAAQLDYDNNWFWLVVQAGFFGLTVYEVFNAVEGLIDTFDRMSADGELSPQEADELVQTAKTFGLTITFEVTAGKVVKGLKIAAIAGDFAVTAAKAIGLDRALAKLNDRFQTIGGLGKGGTANDNVPPKIPNKNQLLKELPVGTKITIENVVDIRKNPMAKLFGLKQEPIVRDLIIFTKGMNYTLPIKVFNELQFLKSSWTLSEKEILWAQMEPQMCIA